MQTENFVLLNTSEIGRSETSGARKQWT